MFGWFRPRPPVDICEKVWTELRMNWLIAEFGLARLRETTTILPTAEFFPDPFDGSRESAHALFERVCRYMQVDPQTLDLDFYPQHEEPDAAGLYHHGPRGLIRISESQLDDQPRLIATLAHETAHEILLGGGRLTGHEPDHEWTTDLLTAFLGLGIFGANAAVQQKNSRHLNWESWQISKHGYLPARVYGYAFALSCRARNELAPAWADHLSTDSRVALASGLKYLQKTGDTLFNPEAPETTAATRSAEALIQDLRSASAGVRVAALWQVAELEPPVPDLEDPLLECLKHSDADVRREAADAYAAVGAPTEAAIQRLSELLDESSASLRARAAAALGRLAVAPSTIVASGRPLEDELIRRIHDESRTVAVAAAQALAESGCLCPPAAEALLRPLKTALVNCDFTTSDGLLSALRVFVPDVRQFLKRRFDDPELRDAALTALQHAPAAVSLASRWEGRAPGTESSSLQIPGGRF